MVDHQHRWAISARGRTRVSDGVDDIALRPKERAVVAALAFHHPSSTRALDIAELMWGDEIPRTYVKSLQNHVARLRQVAPELVETVEGGYRLRADTTVDAVEADSPGPPFGDLVDGPEVAARREVLRAEVEQTENASLRALVDRGDEHALTRVREAVADRPLSEFRRILLARFLAQQGQRRDALVAIDDAHSTFRDAGLKVGDALGDLERRLLDADPTLLSRRPAPTLDPQGRTRRRNEHIVGYQNYLDQARESLQSAETTTVISLTGDAGTGKTTIAGCIRDFGEQSGFTTYSASCSAEPSVPLEPFRDLLTQIHERYPDHLAEIDGADALQALDPSLAPRGVDHDAPRIDRDSLFDAVSTALRCSPRPTLVVIEDLHRASPGTMRLLRRCRDGNGPGRLVLVVTSRAEPTALDGPLVRHVPVVPWSEAEVALYVARFGQSAEWTAAAAGWIAGQTDGVALHVRELTLEALNHSEFDSENFHPPSTVPESLVAHLDRQLRRLSPSTVRVLQAAATLGRRFDVDTLATMVEDPIPGLEEATAADVVERLSTSNRCHFRHDLYQRVVADATPAGTRVELHDLAARTLATTDAEPVEIARHALAASLLDPGRAIRAGLLAADRNAERHEYEEAAALCLEARELSAKDEREWCEATLLAGNMWLRIGDERALTFLRTAAEAAIGHGDQLLIARTIAELCRLGLTSVVAEVDEETRRLLDAALELTTDAIPRALTATAAAQVYATSGHAEASREFFLDALDCARSAGDSGTIQNVLGATVITMHEPDDLAMREAAVDELAGIAETTGSAEILWSAAHLRISNQLQCGDPAMRDTLTQMERLAATLRQRTRSWELSYWQATMALVDGDFERAEALAESTLEYGDAIAGSLLAASYGGLLLSIRCAADRADELNGFVATLIEDQEAIGGWHAAFAFTSAAAGDLDTAAETVARVVADDCALLSRDFAYSGAMCLLGRTAATVGDLDACHTVSRLLEPWSARWAWVGTCTLGPVDLVRARLADATGDRDRGAELAGLAVAQCQRAGAPAYGAEAAAYRAER